MSTITNGGNRHCPKFLKIVCGHLGLPAIAAGWLLFAVPLAASGAPLAATPDWTQVNINGLTTVRFKTLENIVDYECHALEFVTEVAQKPAEWAFSRKG